MSRSDENIKELLKATREHDGGMHDIVEKNQLLVEYTGEELNDMEDIPGWEYLMSAAEKLYEQYQDDIEDANIEWSVFEYGVDRFMVWGELARFIEGMKEQAEIDTSYE